jgi:hypothetical protein
MASISKPFELKHRNFEALTAYTRFLENTLKISKTLSKKQL